MLPYGEQQRTLDAALHSKARRVITSAHCIGASDQGQIVSGLCLPEMEFQMQRSAEFYTPPLYIGLVVYHMLRSCEIDLCGTARSENRFVQICAGSIMTGIMG